MDKGLKIRTFLIPLLALVMSMGGAPSSSAQEASPTPAQDFLAAPAVPTETATIIFSPTPRLTSPGPVVRFYGATDDSLLRLGEEGSLQLEQPLMGGATNLELQPDGSILVAGGLRGVCLLRFTKGEWREVWNWETLGFGPGDITSAVAADRDPNGRVSLVLAAQPGKNRIFLAEARSHQVKVRWEFRMELPPRRAGICTDTKNFWVLSGEAAEGGAWRLEEVEFKKEKVVWALDITAAAMQPYDVLWSREGKILISDPATASVAAFDRKQNRFWQSAPLGAAPVSFLPLSWAGRQKGAGCLVSYGGGPEGSPNRVVELDAESGDEMGWVESLSRKGQVSGLPAFTGLAAWPVEKSSRQPSAASRRPSAAKVR